MERREDSARRRDQDIVQDERGQDQPKNKERAQLNPGLKSQKEAAERQPPSPGEPAGGK